MQVIHAKLVEQAPPVGLSRLWLSGRMAVDMSVDRCKLKLCFFGGEGGEEGEGRGARTWRTDFIIGIWLSLAGEVGCRSSVIGCWINRVGHGCAYPSFSPSGG